MKYIKTIKTHSKGFTLVEIIVTIIAAGILGAIFINFMGTALTSSWNAVEITRDEAGSEALMEQIVGDYVVLINGNNPENALSSIDTTYGGQTINGIRITTQYISFDSSGNELTSGTDYLKVVLQSLGPGAPAITGRYSLTAVLAKNRDTDDHFVLY